MKMLLERLRRWANIAQHTHEKKNWDECSLLHSFGDQVSKDLREAVRILEYQEKCLKLVFGILCISGALSVVAIIAGVITCILQG